MKSITYPIITSNRLAGIELEIHDPRKCGKLPRQVDGWEAKGDASITGVEYVLAKPMLLGKPLMDAVERLSKAIKESGAWPRKKGAIHVHVSAPDYTDQDAFKLALLYANLAKHLRKIIGDSRSNNKFCPIIVPESAEALATMFGYTDRTAVDRVHAKTARKFAAIQLCMLACAEPSARSVEFRGFSAARRSVSIYGFAALAIALTDVAKRMSLVEVKNYKGNLETLVPELAEWIKWREEFISAKLDTEKLIAKMGSEPRGVFWVVKELNCSTSSAGRALSALAETGALVKTKPGYYRVAFENRARAILADIRAKQGEWIAL